MMWTDYNIDQVGDNFKVMGEWEGEVMGKQKDGSDKGYALYRPSDMFLVNEKGWLIKIVPVVEFIKNGVMDERSKAAGC